jgi:phospholipid/cholesterol/gamma-HCH transport system substrate-binding protein
MAKRNVIVGLFVLAAFGLFTAGLFLIGNRHEAISRHMEFYTEFSNVSGLARGSKVQVSGMDAGQIMDIAVPSWPASKFRVKFRIEEKLHGLVRTDSLASVGTEGVVGDTYLSISSGSAQAAAAPPQMTLPSKEPTQIGDLLDQAKGTITDVDNTVRNANGLLMTVGGNLNGALNEARATLTNANDIVVGVKQGHGAAGMLLRDDAVAGQIRETLSNTQQATLSLSHASAQANSIVSDIQSRRFPEKIDDTLAGVKDTVSNLDTSSQQIRQTIADLTAPDSQGVTAGVNLQESLSNVNDATRNLAEDSEALKHNLLFRPFFRHRGYYNLVHLTPDQYRKNRLVGGSANHRSWLSAEQLFQKDPQGIEQLTTEGKKLLDTTLIQYGDSIIESPLIVEGYSNDGNLADRMEVSRHRSLLVRSYLVRRFQLAPGNVDSVALQSQPPKGVDHAAWDGVSIVALREQP